MTAPVVYEYLSPLEGYQDLPPLPDEKNEDQKSYVNPPAPPSEAYQTFVSPIAHDARGGFDVHIYFYQKNEEQVKFATELWERIRREFPELRIYRIWHDPIGPHTVGMFEVNIFTPLQFGAFIPWLVIHRGPLSALIHPNTGDDERDHTQRATWMGDPMPLDLAPFHRMRHAQEKLKGVEMEQEQEQEQEEEEEKEKEKDKEMESQ